MIEADTTQLRFAYTWLGYGRATSACNKNEFADHAPEPSASLV